MGLHAFVAYLKYRWEAKSRHSVHSPFVYDFVEHVLRDKGLLNLAYLTECRGIPLKYENLICRIAAYYNYVSVVSAASAGEGSRNPGIDMLLLYGVTPADWAGQFDRYAHLLKNEGAVVLTGIHGGKAHTKAWRQLACDERVRMSVDLYGLGILFFRKEFREQQHFVLRY